MENLTSIDGNGKTPKLKKICSQKLIDWLIVLDTIYSTYPKKPRQTMKPNTGSVNFGRVSLQFKKSHNTHFKKPICVCQKNPNVVVGTPPKLLKLLKFFPKTTDEQHQWLNFSLPTNPKTLQQERKKDVTGGGAGGLETKQG